MLPFIVAGVVGVAAVVGGVYKYATSNKADDSSEEIKKLGSFAVWGQPDTGKTTFIARLRGLEPKVDKEQTTSLKRYSAFNLRGVDGGAYEVRGLVDMPGSKDRLNDWLKEALLSDHVFYVVDLSRVHDQEYFRKVKYDVAQTVDCLASSAEGNKKVNIIGTHLDASEWKSVDAVRVNNVVIQDQRMRELSELFGKVAGYVYSVNLTDDKSSSRLLQDIANDCEI